MAAVMSPSVMRHLAPILRPGKRPGAELVEQPAFGDVQHHCRFGVV